MLKIKGDDPCPCGSGKKYKDCCLAKSRGQEGQKEKASKSKVPAVKKSKAPAQKSALDDERFNPTEAKRPEALELA